MGDDCFVGVLVDGMARLRTVCDPAEVNTRAFADQAKRIAEVGGREAIAGAMAFNHTPVP